MLARFFAMLALSWASLIILHLSFSPILTCDDFSIYCYLNIYQNVVKLARCVNLIHNHGPEAKYNVFVNFVYPIENSRYRAFRSLHYSINTGSQLSIRTWSPFNAILICESCASFRVWLRWGSRDSLRISNTPLYDTSDPPTNPIRPSPEPADLLLTAVWAQRNKRLAYRSNKHVSSWRERFGPQFPTSDTCLAETSSTH